MDESSIILSVLQEAMSEAGGMLAVQAMTSIMMEWLSRGEQSTIEGAHACAEQIVTCATDLRNQNTLWSGYRGTDHTTIRFDVHGFNQHFLKGEEGERLMNFRIGEYLMALDRTYQERFDIQSALHFLEQLADTTKLFQEELGEAAHSSSLRREINHDYTRTSTEDP